MPFLLDTNVAIHLRDGDPGIKGKIAGLTDDVFLSIITRVELEGGVLAEQALAPYRRARLDTMFALIRVVDFDEGCADAYRAIVERAGYSRRKVMDRMIAAQALAHSASLVTMNARDFRDVAGLTLLEW